MGLEAATYITSLRSDWPLGGDPRNQGDDHLRLIKFVLLATFPNLSGPVTVTPAELNRLSGVTSNIQTQLNTLSTSIIPPGTRMPFYQASPPVGWTAVTLSGINDYMMRVVPAAGTAGTFGGTMNPVLMNVVPSHTHSYSGTTASDSHQHTVNVPLVNDSGAVGYPGYDGDGNRGVTGTYTTSSNTHSHTFSGTADVNGSASNWTPRYADFCIGQKT